MNLVLTIEHSYNKPELGIDYRAFILDYYCVFQFALVAVFYLLIKGLSLNVIHIKKKKKLLLFWLDDIIIIVLNRVGPI